jgi:hypothetical protein
MMLAVHPGHALFQIQVSGMPLSLLARMPVVAINGITAKSRPGVQRCTPDRAQVFSA